MGSDETVQVVVVGIVRSPVRAPVDEHWGEVVSEIHIQESLRNGLIGIEQYSHLLIVFWMHRSSFDPETDLVRHPRGRADIPAVGIFAQRAKHRPNPIGVTTARLLRVEGNVLFVQGLDAIDGTPVLDLKPYNPAFDCPADAVVPSWVDTIMQGYF